MINIQNLSFSFTTADSKSHTIFHNFSLNIKPGERLCILGHNGSGKTSLCNILMGHLTPTKGSIEIHNQNITQWPSYQRAKLISYMGQDPAQSTAPNLTVAENIAMAIPTPLWKPLCSKKKNIEIQKILHSFGSGLSSKLNCPIKTLSGGQRQLVALIMATYSARPLLLLDELTSALDPKAARSVLDHTEEIISRQKLTSVFITHNIDEALHFSTRIITLQSGSISNDFSQEEVKQLSTQQLHSCISSPTYPDPKSQT